MTYYAKTNTADPAVGLLRIGEVLTDEQVAALGAEKVGSMVRRGVLGIEKDSPIEEFHPAAAAEPPAAKAEKPEKGEEADDGEDGEGEMPELEIGDDLIGEGDAPEPEPEPEPEKKPKRRGRK